MERKSQLDFWYNTQFKMIRIDRSVYRRDTNRVSTHIKADDLKQSYTGVIVGIGHRRKSTR